MGRQRVFRIVFDPLAVVAIASPALYSAARMQAAFASQLVALGLILVLAFVLWVAWYTSPGARFKRALKARATSPIRRIRGRRLAKISGQVRRHEKLLSAPLTGRTCVVYWVVVEEMKATKNSWTQVINEHHSVDFLVEDPSGIARVDVSDAQPLLVMDAHFRSGTLNDADRKLEAYLESFGTKSTGALGFNRTLRYREGVLEPGERVVVLGSTTMEADSTTGGAYRSRSERPVFGSRANGPLLLSDDPSLLDDDQGVSTGAARAQDPSPPCPSCGSRRGFRTTPENRECLSCGESSVRRDAS